MTDTRLGFAPDMDAASVSTVRGPVLLADADRARIATDLRRINRAERRLHALLVELADNGRPIAALAREMGMSRQSFYENLARWREELAEE